jgi:predicted dehydrogenase
MVPGVQGVGKQIEIRIYGDKGMITYGGDDSDPDSGELVFTDLEGNSENISGGFLFEDTTEPTDPDYGVGPASVSSFIDGCLGRSYFEGASGETGQAVVQLLEAMYVSAKSGKLEKVVGM